MEIASTMRSTDRATHRFTAHHFHDGARWNSEVYAYDFADAEAQRPEYETRWPTHGHDPMWSGNVTGRWAACAVRLMVEEYHRPAKHARVRSSLCGQIPDFVAMGRFVGKAESDQEPSYHDGGPKCRRRRPFALPGPLGAAKPPHGYAAETRT
jgi:hypothetical protein